MAVETVWLILVFIGSLILGASVGFKLGRTNGYSTGFIEGGLAHNKFRSKCKTALGTTRLCDKKV